MNKFELDTVNNHNEFAFLAENREIISSNKSLLKLTESIVSRGILQPVTVMPFDVNNPLHLLKDGEAHLLADPNDKTEMTDISKIKYLILDGAHRFVLARENQIEIPIFINRNLSRLDIISMNNLATKWTTANYVDSFARLGMPHYINLKTEAKKWKLEGFKSLTDVAIQYSNSLNASAAEEIRTQEFELNKEKGDEILGICNKFKGISDFYESNFFQKRAFMALIGQLVRKYGSDFPVDDIINFVNTNDMKLYEKNKRKEKYEEEIEEIIDSILDQEAGGGADRYFTVRQKVIQGHREIKNDINCCKAPGCSTIGLNNLAMDHKTPFDGYNTKMSNAQLLCTSCNSSKGRTPFIEWHQSFFKED